MLDVLFPDIRLFPTGKMSIAFLFFLDRNALTCPPVTTSPRLSPQRSVIVTVQDRMKMMLEDEDGMEQEQGEEDRNRQRALDDEEGKKKRGATATNHGPACSKDEA